MEGPQPTPKEIIFYFLKQLFQNKAMPEEFICLRVIHNATPYYDTQTGKKIELTDVLYQQNIAVKNFKEMFLEKGLYETLQSFNTLPTKPGNVYFGVNPRNTVRGNKKEHCDSYVVYYLDLDDNKGYSKEDRAKQITFWIEAGYAPSIVIDSGHGYHVYWLLKRRVPTAVGEPVLKRMVAITGCKMGGNTFDVTRILRLPGFLNQKGWFKHDSPPCHIVVPTADTLAEYITKGIDLPLYDPEIFEVFPPSETKDIESYVSSAQTINGNFTDNLKMLVDQTGAELKAQIQNEAKILAAQATQAGTHAQLVSEASTFKPHVNSIPPTLVDLPWPHGQKAWMMQYCLKGYDGLTEKEMNKIREKLGVTDISASELDFRIIYHLVKKGYTFEAVSTLWSRPDIKLYRPDKEKKNPNYLKASYDKALEIVRNSISHKDPGQLASDVIQANRVFIQQNYIMCRKGETVSEIMHGRPLLKGIYQDLDGATPSEREYYDLTITVPKLGTINEMETHAITIPRKAFNSLTAFKEFMSGKITLLTDRPSDLQRLALFINEQGVVPRGEFHSKLSYKDNKFVFPRLIIEKDKFTTTNIFDTVIGLQHKFPWHDYFVKDVMPREEVVAMIHSHWGDVLHIHLPRVVMSILGVIAASAIRAMFGKEGLSKSLHVPTVNIRGSSSTGKSETVKILYRLACVVNDQAVVSTQTSEFALNRMVELLNFVPIVIDEFKEEEIADKNCARVRSLVRRAYTGELLMRGRADQSVISYRLHGATVVIGESPVEKAGDIASITRVLPIDTDEFGPRMNASRFNKVEGMELEAIGPYFFQFLLNQDVKNMYHEICELKGEILTKITSSFGFEIARVTNNIASIIYGCKLWDRFIRSMDPTAPTFFTEFSYDKDLVEYICEWSKEQGHSLTYEVNATPAETKPTATVTAPATPPYEQIMPIVGPGYEITKAKQTVAISRNELLKFIEEMSFIISTRDNACMNYVNRQIPFFYVNEERNEMGLSIAHCIAIHRDWSNYTRRIPIQPSKIRSQIKAATQNHAEYLANENQQKRKDKHRFRYTVFKLKALRDMEIWHDPSEFDTRDPETTEA